MIEMIDDPRVVPQSVYSQVSSLKYLSLSLGHSPDHHFFVAERYREETEPLISRCGRAGSRGAEEMS